MMNIGKACAIFNQIDNPDYTTEEKGEAILHVLQMPTKMSITKAAMEKVIWWLLDLSFEIPEDERPQESREVTKHDE